MKRFRARILIITNSVWIAGSAQSHNASEHRLMMIRISGADEGQEKYDMSLAEATNQLSAPGIAKPKTINAVPHKNSRQINPVDASVF